MLDANFRVPEPAPVHARICRPGTRLGGTVLPASAFDLQILALRQAHPYKFATLLVTAQVGWIAHERRRDFAKFEGSLVTASMMFQLCFLAVEKKERMTAKSIAPSNDRKPPEIFWRSFIMRPSRSA